MFFVMYKELNVTTNHHIQVCYLNRISVTKGKLVGWLESRDYMLLTILTRQCTVAREFCAHSGSN